MKKIQKFIPIFCGLFLFVALLLLQVFHSDIIRLFEHKLYDYRMRFSNRLNPPPVSDDIILVTVDHKSIDQLGRWPWSRELLARLIDVMVEHYQISLVGIDIVFSEPQEFIDIKLLEEYYDLSDFVPPDKHLANIIQKHSDAVVLGYFFTDYEDTSQIYQEGDHIADITNSAFSMVTMKHEGLIPSQQYGEFNIPVIAESASYSGHFNAYLDADGVIRKGFVLKKYESYFCMSLAMQLFARKNQPLILDIDEHGIPSIRLRHTTIPLNKDGSVLINYAGGQKTFPHYSAADILQKKVPVNELRGKTSIIGVTEVGIFDLRSTPLETNFPGVEIHANVLNALQKENFILRGWREDLHSLYSLIFITVFFIILHLIVKHQLFKFALYFAGFLLLIFINLYFFSHQRWIDLFLPLLCLGGNFGIYSVWDGFFSQKEMRYFRKAMGHYLSPGIIEDVAKNPEKLSLYGESRTLPVLFSDIRSFTTISENISPQDLVQLLIQYFTPMTQIILDNNGTLDKYMGDCIMAFWGAPLSLEEAEKKAVITAITMFQYLDTRLNPSFIQKNYPALAANYGIATGPVAVGNMGSEHIFDYTVIGDPVNLASRLESVNKYYGTKILICENTYKKVQENIAGRHVDCVMVKGKTRAINIYEVFDLKTHLSVQLRNKIDDFNEVVQRFFNEDLEVAGSLLEKYIRAYPEDLLASFYKKRLENILNGKEQFKPYTSWDTK